MAEPSPTAGAEDLVRRLVDANVTYVKAWGTLVTDWLSEVSAVAKAAPSTVSVQTPRATAPAHTHDEPVAEPAAAAVLVLEGAAGTEAAGAFEVENVLDTDATGLVVVDPFRDPAGQPVDVAVVVTPSSLELPAHASVIVSVRATVPETAVPGVDHRSTVRVEGIPAGTIAVVLRRTDE